MIRSNGILRLALAVLPGLCFPSAPVTAAPVTAVPYRACFQQAAALHGIDAALLTRVAAVESAFDPMARSHRNAHGLMQIQWPGTARHLGVRRVAELYHPCRNVELGARYLVELLARFDGDTSAALAAYNLGPTRVAALRDAGEPLPASVANYVARIQGAIPGPRRAAARPVAAGPVAAAAGEPIVLQRFASKAAAGRFERAVQRQVPGLALEIVRGQGLDRGTWRVLAPPADRLDALQLAWLRDAGATVP